MTVYDRPFGRYLEDFVPGDVYRHWPGKTITEYDDHLVLHDHDEPPPAAHERVVRRERDGAGQERRGRQPRLLPRPRDERARRERLVHRQPRGRVRSAHRSPTFHGDTIYAETRVLEATPSKSKDDRGIVTVETKAFNQARARGLLLPPQAHGVEVRRGAAAPASLRRRRLGLSPPLPAERARRFRRRLLEWGSDHRRDLPWRHTRDPWRILVSEVMLQQTQVDRVVPHYERFLAAFPTPAACATRRPRRGRAPLVGPRLQPASPQPAPCGQGRGGRACRRSCRATTPRCGRSPVSAPTRPGRCVRSPSARTWRRSTPTPCACWLAVWPALPCRSRRDGPR